MKIVPEVLAQQDPIKLGLPASSQFINLVNISAGDIVQYGIQLILVLAAVIFFFILVTGGIRWITSGGDKGQTEAARAQITAAFIGLVVVFAAWAILGLVGTFFGVNLLSNLDVNP